MPLESLMPSRSMSFNFEGIPELARMEGGAILLQTITHFKLGWRTMGVLAAVLLFPGQLLSVLLMGPGSGAFSGDSLASSPHPLVAPSLKDSVELFMDGMRSSSRLGSVAHSMLSSPPSLLPPSMSSSSSLLLPSFSLAPFALNPSSGSPAPSPTPPLTLNLFKITTVLLALFLQWLLQVAAIVGIFFVVSCNYIGKVATVKDAAKSKGYLQVLLTNVAQAIVFVGAEVLLCIVLVIAAVIAAAIIDIIYAHQTTQAQEAAKILMIGASLFLMPAVMMYVVVVVGLADKVAIADTHWGFAAVQQSRHLIKGGEWTGLFLVVLELLVATMLSPLEQVLFVLPSGGLGFLMRFTAAIFIAAISTLRQAYFIVAGIVFYYSMCSSNNRGFMLVTVESFVDNGSGHDSIPTLAPPPPPQPPLGPSPQLPTSTTANTTIVFY